MRANLLFLLLCFCLFLLSAHAAAIHDAAKNGDVPAIAAVLDEGADVNEGDKAGQATALYYAAITGHLEAARFLIERSADVNRGSEWGRALIIDPAARGYFDILKLLLANGANPNSQFNSDTA